MVRIVGDSPIDSVYIHNFKSSLSTLASFVKSTPGASEKEVPEDATNDIGETGDESAAKAGPVDESRQVTRYNVAFQGKRFFVLEKPPFFICIQAETSDESIMVDSVLESIERIIQFHLGSFAELWNDLSIIDSIVDIIRSSVRLFTTEISVVAPVPLPAAGWMLMAGVGGLISVRRKKVS